ncbi:hypothetical protein ACMXYQ_05210 [Neptuniibacter sp. PT34_22]|uniref:hypothetical protein n=1 Tax=Neptuniibacter sp. PT34_22 TaxID=3398205 RepID=UPI0039F475D0
MSHLLFSLCETLCFTLSLSLPLSLLFSSRLTHRCHAADLAEAEEINAKIMKGTYEDAVQFAMSANWENGLRPKAKDAERSINMLLATAPDFGYDSKAVNKWVTSFGIPASTARNYTKDVIEKVKAALKEAARPLYEEGVTFRKAADSFGLGERVLRGVYEEFQAEEGVTKCPEDKMSQESDVPSTPDEHDETPEEEIPMFDEDSLDTSPAFNPADAFQKALDEHEEERQY